jgi:outer membrane immunogenic protein
MKTLIAAASVAALSALVPALAQAQTVASPGAYGTLGYADAHTSGVDLGAIQGRLGYHVNNWFGVEGELAGGVTSDKSSTVVSGTTVNTKTKLQHEEAIYGVGFLPVTPNIDLIGRVGYGHTKAKVSASTTGATPITVSDTASGDSWNYGVGAQYHIDPVNGVRADYTREEFTGSNNGHADVWAVAYTRRF